MKRFLLTLAAVLCLTGAQAQKFRNAYYDTRIAAHGMEGLAPNAIVFVGNSITEQGWWQMLIPNRKVENRGIGGDNTYGMLDRLPGILESDPRTIFLMAGINDLSAGLPVDQIAANIEKMSELVHAACPDCRLCIQSVLPVNDRRLAYPAIKGRNEQVKELNARLLELCGRMPWTTWVDLWPLMADEQGQLRLEYTKDGIHLHPAAYQAWVKHLKKEKLLK